MNITEKNGKITIEVESKDFFNSQETIESFLLQEEKTNRIKLLALVSKNIFDYERLLERLEDTESLLEQKLEGMSAPELLKYYELLSSKVDDLYKKILELSNNKKEN